MEIIVLTWKNILPYLDSCIASIKLGLSQKVKGAVVSLDANVCLSMLAKAVGSELLGYIKQENMLDQMFAEGLSQTLTDSLGDLAIRNLVAEKEEVVGRTLIGPLYHLAAGPNIVR